MIYSPTNRGLSPFLPSTQIWELLWEVDINGIVKDYRENGQLKEETPYLDGKRHGIQKSYNEEGELSYCMVNENGVWQPGADCMP